ncbi:MAG: polysaccharide pyruvyl transferase family protein [Vampirovibrionales bacterium]|nr:polysaccharide pyruvyl transferase family protein [Vampirovibrionales bacterium]
MNDIVKDTATKRPTPYTAIWGGYGGGNVGDYLTLALAIKDLNGEGRACKILNGYGHDTQKQFPDHEVINLITPPDPKKAGLLSELKYKIACKYQQVAFSALRKLSTVIREPEKLRTIYRRSSAPWLSCLAGAEKLYLVGGGYLNDMFEVDSLRILEAAHYFGIPVETAPVGLGPFKSELAQAQFAQVLKSARLRVRDTESLALAKTMGLEATLQPDDGFRIAELLPANAHRKSLHNPERKLKIGLCIFEQFGAHPMSKPRAHQAPDDNKTLSQRDWWFGFLKALKTACIDHTAGGIEIEGFSFDERLSFEYATMTRLLPEIEASFSLDSKVILPFQNFRHAITHLRDHYDAVITCRFHAAVVAQAYGIPTLAFAAGEYYVAKMESVKANASLCDVACPDRHTPEEAVELLLNLFSQAEQGSLQQFSGPTISQAFLDSHAELGRELAAYAANTIPDITFLENFQEDSPLSSPALSGVLSGKPLAKVLQ